MNLYGRPKIEGDEEFFQEIFNYVNEKNHFILNDKSSIKDGPYSLKFELIFGDITHTFYIGSDGDNKEEKKMKKMRKILKKKIMKKNQKKKIKRGEKKGREKKGRERKT